MRATEVNPEDFLCWKQLALAELARGEVQVARRHMARALKIVDLTRPHGWEELRRSMLAELEGH